MEDYPIKLAGQVLLGKKYFCVWCRREVEGFKNRISAKEFRYSGLCQDCQDEVFGKDKEETL